MKVIAAVVADLEVTPLGTVSRLTCELAGQTVLGATVERLRRAKEIDTAYVLCPQRQQARCEALLAGTGAQVMGHDAAPPPWSGLVRAARKWSLDGWRGGIGGTSHFDEYTDCRILAGLLKSAPADAVLSVPPAAPLMLPDLADRMIEFRKAADEDTRIVFTQAPPGLTGVLLDRLLIAELAEKNIPLGWVLSYKPDSPQKDLIFLPCCFEVPAELRHATGRLVVDTARAFETLIELQKEHPDPDASTIGRWLMEREARHISNLPREVEVELTTDDPYPGSLVSPRGVLIGPRGSIDLSTVAQIAAEMTQPDDGLIVLGGFGDPLRHPQLAAILDLLRPAGGRGVYGLAIRTTGVDLTDAHMDDLMSHGVDVLNVALDAWSAEQYTRLHAPDGSSKARLEPVLAKLDRLADLRRKRGTVHPIVVPEMTKMRENIHELDDFHDGWLRRLGAVCIGGHSHFAGQWEDHAVMSMAPSARTPCRRIQSRCLVLADGRVTICDQDFHGRHAVGRIGPHSLTQIWNGEALTRLRDAHQNKRFDLNPLCAACDEWHRP